MKSFRLGFVVAFAASVMGVTAFAARDKELGVVNYFAKYEYPANRERQNMREREFKSFCAALEKAGYKPEWIDTDIFLFPNKPQRNTYKRIVIPVWADWFTEEMYEGMRDYVRDGGLLVTQSALLLLDKDGAYQCGGVTTTSMCQKTFLGVVANGGAQKPEIKAVIDNPLTRRLKIGEWLPVGPRVAGRCASEGSAQTAVVARQTDGKSESVGPLLTWKSTGKGACVYLSCAYWPENPPIDRMMKNALSNETLKWLCVE